MSPFPIKPIRDDAHLAQVLEIIDRLIDQSARSDAEEAYLGALTDLVEIYEDAHVVIPPTTGLDALRYLVEEHGLTADEVGNILGDSAHARGVLTGEQPLTLEDVRRLAVRFDVPASLFIG
ncbi:MAG TPA: hypothetical protein VF120_16005 [Ktedonobacterales bacterium]